MKVTKNQQVNFISDHGQKLSGSVVDFTEQAIQVHNDLGLYIITYGQLVVPVIEIKMKSQQYSKEDLELGWWD